MIFRVYTGLSLLLAACLGGPDVSYHHGNMTVTQQEAISFCDGLPGEETENKSLFKYMKENTISRAWLRIYKKDLGRWTWTNNTTRNGHLPGGTAERACAGVSSVERVLRPMRCNYGGEHEGVICEHRGMFCLNARCFQQDGVTFTYNCDIANWFAAREHCLKNNGTIAIMDTKEKIGKFSEHKQQNPELALCNFFWVGLRKEDWFIDEEKPAAGTSWRRGEPTPNLNCAVAELSNKGENGWRTVSCTDYHTAVCAKKIKPGTSFKTGTMFPTDIQRGTTEGMMEIDKEKDIDSTTLGDSPGTAVPTIKRSWFIITVTEVAVVAVFLMASLIFIIWRVKRPHSKRSKRNNKPVTVEAREVQEQLIFQASCTADVSKDFADGENTQGHTGPTERKEITLALVMQSCDPPDHIPSYIRFNVNESICQRTGSQMRYNIVEYLCKILDDVVPRIIQDVNVVVIINHLIVHQRMINGKTLDKITDILLASNTDVVYLNVTIPLYEYYSKETEQKLHHLSQRCVIITPALKSKLAQSTITVGPTGRASSSTSIYGGLLDFFIDQTEYESDGKAGGFASALASVIRIFSKSFGNEPVLSTRAMRRFLVDLCEPPQVYDPVKGFGTLRVTEDVFNSNFLKKILDRHVCIGELRKSHNVPSTQLQEEESKTDEAMVTQMLTLLGRKQTTKVIGVIFKSSQQKSDITGLPHEVLCPINSDFDMKDLIKFVFVCVGVQGSGIIYTEAIQELMKNNADVIIDLIEDDGDDTDMYKCLNDTKKTCVIITGLDQYSVKIFPSADVIAVRYGKNIGTVGGRIDFCEPVREAKGSGGAAKMAGGPWFTGTVVAFIIMMAEVKGLSRDRLVPLRSTTVMRHVLVDMCTHPDEHLPGEGYGVLDPWPFLVNWQALKSIIDIHTEDNETDRYWRGKDI